jgi:hypothetical protein
VDWESEALSFLFLFCVVIVMVVAMLLIFLCSKHTYDNIYMREVMLAMASIEYLPYL